MSPLLETFANASARGYELFGPAGGPAGAYELISTSVLGADAGSFTFSSLNSYSSNYKHLQIRCSTRNSSAVGSRTMLIQFNGDSGYNYAQHSLRGNGSSVSSTAGTIPNTWMAVDFFMAGTSQGTNIFNPAIINILDSYSTAKTKTMQVFDGSSGSGTNGNAVALNSGFWNNTAAITSITFIPIGGNIVANSRFSIYGIKG